MQRQNSKEIIKTHPSCHKKKNGIQPYKMIAGKPFQINGAILQQAAIGNSFEKTTAEKLQEKLNGVSLKGLSKQASQRDSYGSPSYRSS